MSSDVFEPRYIMDLLLDWQHYHRFNVMLLSVIGLWPYGNKFFIRLKCTVGCLIILVCLFSQLATFLTTTYTKRLLLRNIASIFITISVLQQYILFIAASDFIRTVTESINSDWRGLSNREEIQIIQKYIERGKFHTKGLAIFMCPVAIVLLFIPLSSVFLDIMMPLDESRNRSFPIMFEVFFNKSRYFLFASFIFDSSVIMAALVFVSTEALLIVYIQHTCALFSITCHRIKRLLCATGMRGSMSSSAVLAIEQVVEIHSKAVRYCKFFKEAYSMPYLVLITLAILSLGSYLFQCRQTLTNHEFTQFLTSALFGAGILSYVFCMSFMFQSIIDTSANLSEALYDTNWYAFPSSSRKLVLFCMLNSTKPIGIDVYGMFYPSYEAFSLIVRITMSYVTALYSFQ